MGNFGAFSCVNYTRKLRFSFHDWSLISLYPIALLFEYFFAISFSFSLIQLAFILGKFGRRFILYTYANHTVRPIYNSELAHHLRRLFCHSLALFTFPIPRDRSAIFLLPPSWMIVQVWMTTIRLFGKCVKLSLLTHNEVFSDRQYGFQPHHFTSDLLSLVSHVWSNAFASFCISKTTFGFSPGLTSLKQDEFMSQPIHLNTGILQGSVRHLILFSLFINETWCGTSNPIHFLSIMLSSIIPFVTHFSLWKQ